MHPMDQPKTGAGRLPAPLLYAGSFWREVFHKVGDCGKAGVRAWWR